MSVIAFHKRTDARQLFSLANKRGSFFPEQLWFRHVYFGRNPALRFWGRKRAFKRMIQQGRKVLLFMMLVSILWEAIVIILSELLILLSSLDLASIAFLPKGKVQVAAIVANPITLAWLTLGFGLGFRVGVLLLKRGDKLMHFGFLLFGF